MGPELHEFFASWEALHTAFGSGTTPRICSVGLPEKIPGALRGEGLAELADMEFVNQVWTAGWFRVAIVVAVPCRHSAGQLCRSLATRSGGGWGTGCPVPVSTISLAYFQPGGER